MIGKKNIVLISGVTGVYLALFGITFWLLMPCQAHVAEKYLSVGKWTTFLVLPHGFRVVLTWLWQGRAVVLLLPGTALQALIIAEYYGLGAAEWVAMVLSYSCCSLIAFEVVNWFGGNAYASYDNPANWRTVLMVGALAGLINGVINMQLVFNQFSLEAQLWIALNLFVGGMTGLLLWLFAMCFASRHLKECAFLLVTRD
ncbi:hypothetical protein [Aquicoccus sp. SU-CL01552]|uniref:hypothetical protein n=1 Tax=Aquicoccus sp. SU-CL01552 TaxID=3127656 RepID=UPI00333F7F09